MTRHFLTSYKATLAGLCLALAGAGGALAADFPTRPIQLVAPVPAGGSLDTTARVLAEGLQRQFKYSVVVVNKVGGGGLVGTLFVKNAAADGYTLLMGNDSLLIIPNFVRTDLEPEKDIVAIAQTSQAGYLLYVSNKVPANTLGEFIAYVKANPGKVNMGTIPNSSLYLEYLRFVGSQGLKATVVTYPGAAPIATALLRDEVQAYIGSPAGLVEHVKNGGFKAVASGGDKPNPALPNVPLARNLGNPRDYEFWTTTQIVFAPAATPKDLVQTLSAAVVEVFNQPAAATLLRNAGVEAAPRPWNEIGPQATRLMNSSRELARQAGIKPE